jgi:hypothetical protein
MDRTVLNRTGRIGLSVSVCILLSSYPTLMRNAAAQVTAGRRADVEQAAARRGEIGDRECLWGDWGLEAYSSASGAETAERLRFGRNEVSFSSRHASGYMQYQFFPTPAGAEIDVYDPRLVGPRPPGLRTRETGRSTVTMLTNNVFSFRTSEGSASTYRKVVPRRNYLVVHMQEAHGNSPGHIFIQLFSLNPGSRQLVDSRAWGFYPNRLNKAEYTNWHVVWDGTAGDLRDEVNDPVLRRNGHRFYSDDMFIIEISDMDMRRVDELIRVWDAHPPTYHGIRLNCITFVLAALRTLRDRPVEMPESVLAFPEDVMDWIRLSHRDLELSPDEIYREDGYIPCYPWK